jgi:hypothetical protein
LNTFRRAEPDPELDPELDPDLELELDPEPFGFADWVAPSLGVRVL